MHNFLLPTTLVRMVTPLLSGSLRELNPTLWLRVWKRLGPGLGILVWSLSSGADSRRQCTSFAFTVSGYALVSKRALVFLLGLGPVVDALWIRRNALVTLIVHVSIEQRGAHGKRTVVGVIRVAIRVQRVKLVQRSLVILLEPDLQLLKFVAQIGASIQSLLVVAQGAGRAHKHWCVSATQQRAQSNTY